MNKLSGEIKNKKLLIITAAVGVILFAAVFLFSALVNKNKIAENPIVPTVPKEKSMDETIKEMATPVNLDKDSASVSDETIKQMATPVNLDKNSVSVSDETIKDMATPVNINK